MGRLPLDGRSLEQRLAEAKALLQEHGYSVRGPLLSEEALSGVAEYKFPYRLWTYFYDTMFRFNPSYESGYSGNMKEGVGIAASFLTKLREDEGVGPRQAMVQAMRIIDCLFRCEGFLGLSGRITSIRILADSEKTSWIIEKVRDILNQADVKVLAAEDQAWHDKLYRQQEKEIYKRDEELNDAEEENGDGRAESGEFEGP